MAKVELAQFQGQLAELFDSLPPAEDRYNVYGSFDPYPEIPPALLSAGHLASYVAMTGMLDDMDITELRKPASFKVALEGEVRYKSDTGEVESFILTNTPEKYDSRIDVRASFILRPNSLCYVTLKPYFRMPEYLAARFNLLIRDVYRGLLVGTGPLVDPGFQGRLSIPIHNLTTNEYPLTASEGFVYFEFTKTSWQNPVFGPTTPIWFREPLHSQPPFPSEKNRRRGLDDYLMDATGTGAAQNAIGAQLSIFRTHLDESKKNLDQSKNFARLLSLAAVGGVVGLVFSAWSIYMSSMTFTQDAKNATFEAQMTLREELRELRSHIETQTTGLELSIGANGTSAKIVRPESP